VTSARTRGGRKSPRQVRIISFVALAWAVIAVLGAAVFSVALAPALGATFDLHLVGRRSTGDIAVDTGFMSTLSFAVAVVLLFFAVAALALRSVPVILAQWLAGGVCFVTPLYLGVLLPNAVLTLVDPAHSNDGLLFVVGVAGLVGLLFGGATMVLGPIVVEAVLSSRRVESPVGRPEA